MNIYQEISTSKTEKFINKANIIYKDLYNYSKVEYITSALKVIIICKDHGIFEKSPNNHLKGQGCSTCGILLRTKLKTSNIKNFIKSSIYTHGDLYNYEKVNYINNYTKVKIICKIHGVFEQTPQNHLRGQGCRHCGYAPIFTEKEQSAKMNARNAKRRATKLKAIPKWGELSLIKQLYIDCTLISEMTGIKHHVDHIVPLQSEIVCGLHCITNLQIIPALENHAKSNLYWPDM